MLADAQTMQVCRHHVFYTSIGPATSALRRPVAAGSCGKAAGPAAGRRMRYRPLARPPLGGPGRPQLQSSGGLQAVWQRQGRGQVGRCAVIQAQAPP